MQRQHRLLAIGFAVLLLAGLCVHYGATYEDNWPHPTADELTEQGATFDGERVLLIGVVTDVRDGELTMMLETSAGDPVPIEVRHAEAAVDVGGVIQVYGVLDDGGTTQYADRIVVVNEDSTDRAYKLGVSALAGIVTAGLFLYYWRINVRTLRFEVRHG